MTGYAIDGSPAELQGDLPEPPRRGAGGGAGGGDESAEQAAKVVSGLFRRDSLYVGLWALQIAGAALVTPVATRLMGPGQFGLLAVANSTMQVVFTVLGLGLSVAIPRAFPGAAGDVAARRLLTLAVLGAAVGGTLACTAGSLGARVAGLSPLSTALQLSLAWAATSAVTVSCMALLKCRDQLGRFAAVGLVQSLGAELVSVALLGTVTRTATSFVLGQLLAQVVALGLGLWWCRPARIRRRDSTTLRASLWFCLPMVPSALAALLVSLSDRFVIEHALGPVEVARYQIAANIGTVPVILLGALSTTWLPRLFAVEAPRSQGVVHASSRDQLWRLLMPVMLGMAAGAPPVLLVWAPESFRPDELRLVTTVLALSALPCSGVLSITRALLTVGGTRFVAASGAVVAALSIGLNLVLVPRFHLMGAALTAVVTQCLLYVVLKARTRRRMPIPPPTTGLRLFMAAVVVATLAIGGLPVSGPALGVRAVLALGALVWLGLTARRVTRRAP